MQSKLYNVTQLQNLLLREGFSLLTDEIKSLGLKDQRTYSVRHVSTLVAFISRKNI